jgi:O-antigen ligase
LCVIQLAGFNPLWLYPKGTNFFDAGVIYTTAFIGTTGNTNLTGAFICTALPFLAVTMLKSRGKFRFLLLIPTLLLLYIVLRMGVDSAILGLAVCFIITFPMVLNFKKKAVFLYIISILILAVLFVTFIYFYPGNDGFFHEVSEILHGRIDESFGSGRIRIWKNVLGEICDKPIFGKGPDTMQKEKFPPFERFYPARNKVMRTGIDVAHNEPLNILYHQGVLGLLAYSGFVFFVLRAWYKNRNDALILALGSSVICYLVQSFFTFSMCISAPYFWICAALIVGLCERK